MADDAASLVASVFSVAFDSVNRSLVVLNSALDSLDIELDSGHRHAIVSLIEKLERAVKDLSWSIEALNDLILILTPDLRPVLGRKLVEVRRLEKELVSHKIDLRENVEASATPPVDIEPIESAMESIRMSSSGIEQVLETLRTLAVEHIQMCQRECSAPGTASFGYACAGRGELRDWMAFLSLASSRTVDIMSPHMGKAAVLTLVQVLKERPQKRMRIIVNARRPFEDDRCKEILLGCVSKGNEMNLGLRASYDLHSRMVCAQDYTLVSSADLTKASLSNDTEAGLLVPGTALAERGSRFFSQVWDSSYMFDNLDSPIRFLTQALVTYGDEISRERPFPLVEEIRNALWSLDPGIRVRLPEEQGWAYVDSSVLSPDDVYSVLEDYPKFHAREIIPVHICEESDSLEKCGELVTRDARRRIPPGSKFSVLFCGFIGHGEFFRDSEEDIKGEAATKVAIECQATHVSSTEAADWAIRIALYDRVLVVGFTRAKGTLRE